MQQTFHSHNVCTRYLFRLAFLAFLAPVWCPAQAPPQYTITTIAGNCAATPCPGNYAGDGGPATNAFLSGPSNVILDSTGSNLYISDTVNNRIREVSSGYINTFAGNGTAGYAGDGSSVTTTGIELYSPTGMAFDSNGNFNIADTYNSVIRQVNPSGIISTVAGDNSLGAGYTGDLGPATAAQLYYPSSVAVDPAGNMYIADPYNNVVRVVCANQTPIACANVAAGDINTFAGNQVTGANYTGDGGPATHALLNDPVAVLLDASGNLYISDSGNNAIRKVTPGKSGIITTVAGMGPFSSGYSGDGGPAIQAELSGPKGIAIDASGYLYIADTVNCVIRVVEPNGTITTIAGKGTQGYSGDGGPATSAQLNFPSGVAVSAGQVYIADNGNNLIRMLTPPAQAPQINAGGVVNGASYAAPVAPGSIADVFGSFYLTSTSVDSDLPLNTSLQNLSFEFGGTLAPLYFVSAGQANLQVPWELDGQSTATIAATLNGTAGAAQTVNVAAFAPAIFSMNSQGTGPGAILDSSYKLVDSSNPATAGTTIILIYCTGLGAVTNQPLTGSPGPSSPLAETKTTPTVTIGGVTETASFSGLAPGFVGLYQVNALVPAGVASGNAVPVTITIGNVTSNTVTIPVQ
ncbi:MAG: hypothetical protein ABSF64_02015 [Bryobacteraceae bacterium]|jgi:uncharacterized protein (TIGR03437 family)